MTDIERTIHSAELIKAFICDSAGTDSAYCRYCNNIVDAMKGQKKIADNEMYKYDILFCLLKQDSIPSFLEDKCPGITKAINDISDIFDNYMKISKL